MRLASGTSSPLTRQSLPGARHYNRLVPRPLVSLYRFCTNQRFVTRRLPNHGQEARFSQRHYSCPCLFNLFTRPHTPFLALSLALILDFPPSPRTHTRTGYTAQRAHKNGGRERDFPTQRDMYSVLTHTCTEKVLPPRTLPTHPPARPHLNMNT